MPCHAMPCRATQCRDSSSLPKLGSPLFFSSALPLLRFPSPFPSSSPSPFPALCTRPLSLPRPFLTPLQGCFSCFVPLPFRCCHFQAVANETAVAPSRPLSSSPAVRLMPLPSCSFAHLISRFASLFTARTPRRLSLLRFSSLLLFPLLPPLALSSLGVSVSSAFHFLPHFFPCPLSFFRSLCPFLLCVAPPFGRQHGSAPAPA